MTIASLENDPILICIEFISHVARDELVLVIKYTTTSQHCRVKHFAAVNLLKPMALLSNHIDAVIYNDIAIKKKRLDYLIPLKVQNLHVSHKKTHAREESGYHQLLFGNQVY